MIGKLINKIRKTCEVLKDYSYEKICDVDNIEYTETGYKENDLPPNDGWKPYPKGSRLYGNDRHYWLKMSFKTPSAPQNRNIILRSSTGYEGERDTINPQCMIFVNGELRQAFDTNHTDLRLEPETDYDIYIYYYTGSDKVSCEFSLKLYYIDCNTNDLYYDISVPLSACIDVYNENSYEYSQTVRILNSACDLLDLNYPYSDEYYLGLKNASQYLKQEYYNKLCGVNNPVTVNCIGHTHIDVAWLWTLAQTKEKVQRSFATVLELMKYYPEYRFMMSQPQLFRYLSEIAPDMYNKVKQLVKEGRWELEGSMWLEADCNLISGESMVRQILHGKRFLKKEFDIDSKILWLPDVFGYSAAMPQILKKSDIELFVTSKISWNDTNTMPNDSFIWQGIDGTEIMTDFITAQDFKRNGEFTNETTYVGEINPSMVAGTWNRYQNKEYNDEVLLAYGWGDGGGGPTTDMLEQQRRLSYGLPGLPKTRMSSLSEHLEHTRRNFISACKKIGITPKWVGELYLEFHRGTYTSMAANKKYNRISEMLMQRVESLSAILQMTVGTEYPKQRIYDMWDVVLLNQFHDIIPGSSIKEVYEDSHRQYKNLLSNGEEIISKGLKVISDNISSEGGVLIYNSLGFPRNGILSIDGKVYETKKIGACGWSVQKLENDETKVQINGLTAENNFFILELDNAGRIKRLYDKRFNREVFRENEFGNEFRIYEDMPLLYENWELASYYDTKGKILDSCVEISPICEGARKGFKTVRKYHNSTITQRIYLYDNTERIDVENQIDWAEHKQLLKLHFPFNVKSNKATYDIQYGSVERNTHKNTSWDAAKFEVCGQKWVDISDYGYGVSLINDCKYGFGADGSNLSLTVLKCGTYPNPVADQGKHEFRFAIYPHKGDYRQANTAMEAYSFNQPLVYTEVQPSDGCLNDNFSLLSLDADGIIIDTVKQCEDDGSYVIRMYEAFDRVVDANLKFGIPVSSVEECDLMEKNIKVLPLNNNSVKIKLNNFEILTLKVSF